jgi:hypothetical protein
MFGCSDWRSVPSTRILPVDLPEGLAMTPEEEKLIAAVEHLERRTDKIYEMHRAAEARRRALVRSLAGPGRSLTVTPDERRQLEDANREVDQVEAAMNELATLRQQWTAALLQIAGGGQDVGG